LAKQLLLEGDMITGNRAYEIGLANYLAEDVFAESINLAEKLNKNSATSMKMTKKMIDNISNLSVRDAVDHCINLNVISRSTEDFNKGIQSFLSKDK
jgi:methylglutaconyl-CoA hydratase